MNRKLLISSSALDAKQKATDQAILKAPRPGQSPARLWPWLAVLLVTGVFLLGGVSIWAANWLRSIPLALNANATQPRVHVTTLNVKRTASYADLNLTVVSAQYASSFSDDLIRPGPAVVQISIRGRSLHVQ